MLRIKGGVYVLRGLSHYDKKYPNNKIKTFGHSKDIEKRSYGYTKEYEEEDDDHFKNRLETVIHSSNQARDGTRLMESMMFYFYKNERMNKSKELFKFEKEWIIQNDEQRIKDMFALSNINDITLFSSLKAVPFTDGEIVSHEDGESHSEDDSSSSNVEEKFKARPYQEKIISSLLNHYKEYDLGGLFLPPGYGKTCISTLFLIDLHPKRVLILTPRLSICNEWEKWLSHTDYNLITFNSESEQNIVSNNRKHTIIISTYQSFLTHKEEFNKFSPKFLICDEAHYLMSENKFSECLELKCKKMFLTATPKIHTIDEECENVITKSLDEEKFGKVIKHVSLSDAIDEGQLCGYRILIHNLPSTTKCHKHIKTLHRKYGRNKIIVFYNTKKSAKEAYEHLKESVKNCYYIDGNTSKDERQKIIMKFEKKKFGVIINIDVLSEGVSINCVDCVLMMEPRNSQKALVQITGRALRLHNGKECSVLCIPTDCIETLEIALTAFCYDSGSDIKVRKNILVESENIEETNKVVETVNKKLRMIEIGKNGGSFKDYKIQLLNECVIANGNKLISQKFIYDGIKLGVFLGNIKQTIREKQTVYKLAIENWRLKYKKLFELIDKKITENKRNIAASEKIKLLDEAVKNNKNNLIPMRYKEGKIELGRFLNNLITAIKTGERYNTEISEWQKEFPKLFKLICERVGENKKKPLCEISPSEKIKLLNEAIKNNENKLIDRKYQQNNIKLGIFLHNLIKGIKTGERYKKEIEIWKKQYPIIFQLINERIN